jgi:hypothetical protein
MNARDRQRNCDEHKAAGKCGRGVLDCIGCEYLYNQHEIQLEDLIEIAKRDPDTKKHGAIVYWHSGVHRYVYFCDHRFKHDNIAHTIMPDGDLDNDQEDSIQ